MKENIQNILLIITIFILCTFIVLFSINYLNIDKSIIKSSKEQKQSSNSLALMYETAPETGEYKVSTDSVWTSTGYTFNSTLSKCENGSTLTYDKTTNKVKVQSTKSDKCYIYFDKIQIIGNKCKNQNLASCMKINYELDNNINFHNSTLANGANDNSYRFSGANSNNYVCFGSGATAAGVACPEENQYRIIGVFGNQVKLIKKTSLGNRVWNSSNVNTWAGSTMDTYLNGEYLNSLTITWSNKIASNTWQVGGMSSENVQAIPATAYTYEVGPNKANVTFNGKIGLMYVSDYGFAASPNFWTTILLNYEPSKMSDWLNINIFEWTISRISDIYSNASYVNSYGYVNWYYLDSTYGTRPVFYLEPSINLIGGNGTSIDPYRIN